jgi:hypothetical protein
LFFDLRTGRKLELDVSATVTSPGLLIACHRAAWCGESGDVCLADLDSVAVRKILSLGASGNESASIALSEDWLVALADVGEVQMLY